MVSSHSGGSSDSNVHANGVDDQVSAGKITGTLCRIYPELFGCPSEISSKAMLGMQLRADNGLDCVLNSLSQPLMAGVFVVSFIP